MLGTIVTVGMKGPFVREVSIKPAAAIEPNPAEPDHVLVSGRDVSDPAPIRSSGPTGRSAEVGPALKVAESWVCFLSLCVCVARSVGVCVCIRVSVVVCVCVGGQ